MFEMNFWGEGGGAHKNQVVKSTLEQIIIAFLQHQETCFSSGNMVRLMNESRGIQVFKFRRDSSSLEFENKPLDGLEFQVVMEVS
jgi:hypothetical protein